MNDNLRLDGDRRTILIVDDEVVNREMLGFFFESSYNVLYAEDGLEALGILREQHSRISLVLLDINMPRMTGKELLRIMNSDEDLNRIPVIVLTSDTSSELETLQIGAIDFIKKPYDMPEIIIARVERIIEFAEGKRIIRDLENDALTGLYTVRFFYEYSYMMMERYSKEQFDILVINLEHFRMVRELYGAAFGDEVLRKVGAGVKSLADSFGGIGCRSNEDDFFVLIRHQDDYREIQQNLREFISQAQNEKSLNILLRMGVYQNVNAGAHRLDWYVHAAKAACSSVQQDYYSDVVMYDDTMYQKDLFRERLIAEMDRALSEKQFQVYFQPKYNIVGEQPQLNSAEALIRWKHPEFGMISPGEFIPLFEKNGLILKLDKFVCEETAEYIRHWHETFGFSPPVSVNLSRMDLYDPHLQEWLLNIVEKNGISVSDMILEITESAFADDENRILKTVGDLRKAGFMIELDDFGSGYSSLNMLCVMPIDALKIDMKFVQNTVMNKNGVRIVELVIEMARALSVPTIVEGVESRDQYQMVKDAGSDIVQGYYFSKPVDADAFTALLKSINMNSKWG